MEVKKFEKLPVYAADIRDRVFVKEQGFSRELEFDGNETRATHIVAFVDNRHAATARFYFEETKSSYLIGRIAVLPAYRKQGLGSVVVTACEEEIKLLGGTSAVIHSQLRAKGFYESLRYSPCSEIDVEEGVEHIWMKKEF